jgi:hypothetical protein
LNGAAIPPIDVTHRDRRHLGPLEEGKIPTAPDSVHEA